MIVSTVIVVLCVAGAKALRLIILFLLSASALLGATGTRPHSSPSGRNSSGRSLCSAHWVLTRPLLVTTIQRLPQRTTESTRPNPGTRSPRATCEMPLGPSKTILPPTISRTVQPGTVVGRVSGVATGRVSGVATGLGLVKDFVRCWFAGTGDATRDAGLLEPD